jgi:hypothetical protein
MVAFMFLQLEACLGDDAMLANRVDLSKDCSKAPGLLVVIEAGIDICVQFIVECPEVLHQPDVAVLLHDGKNWAVVGAASWLNDSELEPFEYMSFDLFSVRNWNFELLDINWLSSF